jgi:hypothetical protein
MEWFRKFLDLRCKRYWVSNNFDHWKFDKKSKFKFNYLGNKFTLKPMAHATLGVNGERERENFNTKKHLVNWGKNWGTLLALMENAQCIGFYEHDFIMFRLKVQEIFEFWVIFIIGNLIKIEKNHVQLVG